MSDPVKITIEYFFSIIQCDNAKSLRTVALDLKASFYMFTLSFQKPNAVEKHEPRVRLTAIQREMTGAYLALYADFGKTNTHLVYTASHFPATEEITQERQLDITKTDTVLQAFEEYWHTLGPRFVERVTYKKCGLIYDLTNESIRFSSNYWYGRERPYEPPAKHCYYVLFEVADRSCIDRPKDITQYAYNYMCVVACAICIAALYYRNR